MRVIGLYNKRLQRVGGSFRPGAAKEAGGAPFFDVTVASLARIELIVNRRGEQNVCNEGEGLYPEGAEKVDEIG